MGMTINTNIAANNSYRNLTNTQNDLSKSLEKLSHLGSLIYTELFYGNYWMGRLAY